MASWGEYVSTKIRGLQYWWNTPLIDQYREACVAKIKECTFVKTSGELIRFMNVHHVNPENGTIRNDDNDPIWFFDKNDISIEYNLKIYKKQRDKYENQPNYQEITFKNTNISLIDFTGEQVPDFEYLDNDIKKSIKQYKINIYLIRAIFDYLYYKHEIYKAKNSIKTDFNKLKKAYGYADGFRNSNYENDRIIIRTIFKDTVIQNIAQGYYCNSVKTIEGLPFHAEYAILQKYVHNFSQTHTRNSTASRDLNNNNNFISNIFETDNKGIITPIEKRGKSPSKRGKSPSKKGGGNPEIEFLKDFIFDPYGEDRYPVTTFMRNYESLIEHEIEDADEIEKVMMYIIDPFIRKKMEEDIVIVIEKMKHMKTEMIVPKTVFMKPISAYGGKTRRHKAKPTIRRSRHTTRRHTFKQ
jgi:hypothetical protein